MHEEVKLTCHYCDHVWVHTDNGQELVRCPKCEQFIYLNVPEFPTVEEE